MFARLNSFAMGVLFWGVLFGVYSPAANRCIDLLGQQNYQQAQSFSNQLKDQDIQAELNLATRYQGLTSPVRLSRQMVAFRNEFLSYFRLPAVREALVTSFENSLRLRSLKTERILRQNKNYGQYDLVIVGTGVHGILALSQTLLDKPNLKVLIVDEGDTAGAVFRYGKDVFSINSSNRASMPNVLPLPGKGNINELPGLPIQVSDLTAVKYPSANDLGSALVAGLYASVKKYPNVDILFNTQVTSLLKSPRSEQFGEAMILNSGEAKPIQIDTQAIIIATGLGEPSLPKKLRKTLIENPNLVTNGDPKRPRVITFEDLIRLMAQSNRPMELFKNLNIGVVGKGDSANVFIEFLLGYAQREGYALSTAQDGRPRKIIWIGQDAKSCDEFIADIRSRYQGISTGFRNSDLVSPGIIKSYSAKLENVEGLFPNQLTAQLVGGKSVEEALDLIVVTTGFTQNIRGLFQDFNFPNYTSDTTMFNREFETVQGVTSVSEGELTKVARKLKKRLIYVVGTAAGQLAAQKELVGIIQNYVSIFNNAPRVVSAVDLVDRRLSLIAAPSVPKKVDATLNLTSTRSGKAVQITGIAETRVIPLQNMNILRSTLQDALAYIGKSSIESENVVVDLKLNADFSISAEMPAGVDVTNLMKILAQTRTFFSLAREILVANPRNSLQIVFAIAGNQVLPVSGNIGLVADRANSRMAPSEVIQNNELKLRGILSLKAEQDLQ